MLVTFEGITDYATCVVLIIYFIFCKILYFAVVCWPYCLFDGQQLTGSHIQCSVKALCFKLSTLQISSPYIFSDTVATFQNMEVTTWKRKLCKEWLKGTEVPLHWPTQGCYRAPSPHTLMIFIYCITSLRKSQSVSKMLTGSN